MLGASAFSSGSNVHRELFQKTVGQVVDVSDGDERFDAAAFGRLERGGDADDAVDAVDGALSQEFVGSFYGSQNAAIAHYRFRAIGVEEQLLDVVAVAALQQRGDDALDDALDAAPGARQPR